MKSKFTPGPWIIYDPEIERSNSIDIRNEDDSLWLFSVMGSHVGPKNIEETKANATLIAAAPDLLTALQDIVKVCRDSESIDDLLTIQNIANSAINKATT